MAGGTLALTASTFAGNSAHGGLAGGNATHVFGGTGGAGQGGGVYAATGTLTLLLLNDTLADNTVHGSNGGPGSKFGGAGGAGQGGGLYVAAGSATLQSSTIAGSSTHSAHTTAGNTATGGTGSATGSITHGSDGAAEGGGVWVNGSATAHLKNMLLANNVATSGPDYFGTAKSSDHDLVFHTAGSTGFGISGSGDVVGTDPHIDGLFNNGGPTQTMAISNTSAAFNKGDNSGAPATDQRGFNRIVGPHIDIGAFEVQTLVDKTSQIGVTRSGVVHKPNTDVFAQTLTLTNTGAALGGGLLVVLNGLPANDLLTAAHFGAANGPSLTVTGPQPGQSVGYAIFISASVLAGVPTGQKFSLALTFQLDDSAAFDYTPQVFQDNS
jgi:hypothetical protein